MARYFGRKVTIDSIKFDSEMEGRYYEELKRRTENDEITLMKDHPKYVLLDNFKYNGENIRGFSYEADFIYVDKENLTIHIEDVKGHVASNDAFTLQWKLFRKEVLKLFTENPLDIR